MGSVGFLWVGFIGCLIQRFSRNTFFKPHTLSSSSLLVVSQEEQAKRSYILSAARGLKALNTEDPKP